MFFMWVLHVKADAAPGGDGAAWKQAINSLAAALEIAEVGQDIWARLRFR